MGAVQISALLPLPCISPAAAGIQLCLNSAETQESGECVPGVGRGIARTAGPRPVAVCGHGLEVTPVSAAFWISSTTASSKLFHE